MIKYFKDQFAVYGDAVEIPNNIQTDGSVSYQQGFTVDYQRRLGSDPLAKPFPRQGFNGLMSDITGAIQQYQQQGFYDFITPDMNGGEAFPYDMGATVRYDMSDAQDGTQVYNFSSLINENKTSPKSNPENWQEIGKSDIEFATDQETIDGELDNKAVSPKGLAAVTATTDRKGLIQIASDDVFDGKINTTQAITTAQYYKGFSNNLLSESGYQIMPNGLIIQWARIYITASPTTYTFPIAFPNACFIVTIGTGEDESNVAEVMNMRPNTLTKTGFSAGATGVAHYSYIAIGN